MFDVTSGAHKMSFIDQRCDMMFAWGYEQKHFYTYKGMFKCDLEQTTEYNSSLLCPQNPILLKKKLKTFNDALQYVSLHAEFISSVCLCKHSMRMQVPMSTCPIKFLFVATNVTFHLFLIHFFFKTLCLIFRFYFYVFRAAFSRDANCVI